VITKVACTNPKCANYEKRKSVASAMLTGYDPKVCPICDGKMKAVEQINTSGKGMRAGVRRPSRSSSRS
jgi:hypothetical protein